LTASVDLIRALGGGWDSQSGDQVARSNMSEKLPAHGT
jgi:outer membrane protein TolC